LKLLTVFFLVSEGASVSSCDDTITTVESDTFKYFRTQFDSVSNNRISVEVRDIEGKQIIGSNLFGIATSLAISGKKLGRGRGSGKEEGVILVLAIARGCHGLVGFNVLF